MADYSTTPATVRRVTMSVATRGLSGTRPVRAHEPPTATVNRILRRSAGEASKPGKKRDPSNGQYRIL